VTGAAESGDGRSGRARTAPKPGRAGTAPESGRAGTAPMPGRAGTGLRVGSARTAMPARLRHAHRVTADPGRNWTRDELMRIEPVDIVASHGDWLAERQQL